MGIPAKFSDPRFHQAMRQVVEAANRHGKLAAIQPGNMQDAEEWLRIGFHFLSWSIDFVVYRTALQKQIQELRKLIAGYTGHS